MWDAHFACVDGGARIAGLTATGRAPVEALALNRSLLVRGRRRWMSAGWHPPD